MARRWRLAHYLRTATAQNRTPAAGYHFHPHLFSLVTMNLTAHLRPAFLALTATVSFAAQAQQPQPVQVTQPDAASLRVRVFNATTKPIWMRVENLNTGFYILNQTHNTPAYGTLLKFNTLPSGRYALTLRVGPDRYRYTIQVENNAPGAATIAVRETTTRRVESGLAAL